jgi:hypothetical protein
LDSIDELARWGLVPPVVVADAGYGQNADFRDGLDGRGIGYVVGIVRRLGAGVGLRPQVQDHEDVADVLRHMEAVGWGQALVGLRPCRSPARLRIVQVTSCSCCGSTHIDVGGGAMPSNEDYDIRRA